MLKRTRSSSEMGVGGIKRVGRRRRVRMREENRSTEFGVKERRLCIRASSHRGPIKGAVDA